MSAEGTAESTSSSEVNKEKMWERAETRTYFFIPGLFRILGVTLHCYLTVGIAFADVGIRIALEWIRNFIYSLVVAEPQKVSNANGAAVAAKKRFDPVSTAVSGFMAFYIRWLYNPISDCWNRPIIGAAAKHINVVAREWKDDHGVQVLKVIPNGPVRRCVNMGSYNYLGFGGPNEYTTPSVVESVRHSGVMIATTPVEMGVSCEQRELEHAIAKFIGKEDAVVVPMGFATNSMVLPALTGPRCLVLSDTLNHASIITGLRASGSTLRRCGHNDPHSLEKELRIAVQETPKWRRIFVVLEGLYSMEGEMCPLPTVVNLCKKYGALLYIDEAHSIGALGPHGRGICDYYGVDPKDVDVLMGTFTKSFGSIGGYVASSHKVVAMLRRKALASIYGVSMSPACAQQATAALNEICTPRGAARMSQLRENSILMRKRLSDAGCMLLGQDDSPVVPIMVIHPWKLTAFSRECLRRGVAVVAVGFPATPLLGLRARLCISAGFDTREIEESAATMIEVARNLGIDYFSNSPQNRNHNQQQQSSSSHGHAAFVSEETSEVCEFHSEPIAGEDEPEPREVRVIDLNKLPRVVLSGHDYLGLTNSKQAIEKSAEILQTYGCGSCGPRGFYGTTDKHLEIESRLASWLNCEAAIVYSYGALAATSVVPPFVSEPNDIVLYDELLNHSARFGVQIAKGHSYPYPHNNIKALEKLIRSIDGEQALKNQASRKGRRVILTEGIFAGTGEILPLAEIVSLKRKYGYLLIVDETHSIGALGSTGKGIREFYAEKAGDQTLWDSDSIDLIVGSLEPSLGSVGGFCVGTRKLVQHQVLSAIGYVFSASMPPYHCSAAVCSIDELQKPASAEGRIEKLSKNIECIHGLFKAGNAAGEIFDLSNNEASSPLMFASLRNGICKNGEEEVKVLEEIEDACWNDNVAVCVARFDDQDEAKPKHPSLRICASAKYSVDDMNFAINTIVNHAREILHL